MPVRDFFHAGYPSCHPTNGVTALKKRHMPSYITEKLIKKQ